MKSVNRPPLQKSGPIYPGCTYTTAALSGNQPLYFKLFAMLLGMPEFVLGLLVQPAFRRGIKRDRKPHRHFRANTCLAVQHGTERFAADSQRFGGDRNSKA